MADVNKVFLIGRLTRDPELRNTPGGAAVCDLGLATNRKWTTKDGEVREEVAYIDVTVWNRQAENCAKFLAKGRSVHVEGYLKMDSWDDRSTGEKRSKLKVEAERVQFLGGNPNGDGSGQEPSQARPSQTPGGPARRPGNDPEPDSEDDIPF